MTSRDGYTLGGAWRGSAQAAPPRSVSIDRLEVDPESLGIWSGIGAAIAGAFAAAFRLGRGRRPETTLVDVLDAIRCEAEETRATLREEGERTRRLLHEMTGTFLGRSSQTEKVLAVILDRLERSGSHS